MTDQLIRRVRPEAAAARGLQIRKPQAVTTVTQTKNREIVHEEEKHHAVPDVAANDRKLIGFVEAAAGVTINTGDYSSLRLDCRVQLPFVFAGEASVDAAYEHVMMFVASTLEGEQMLWVGRVEQQRDTPLLSQIARSPVPVRTTPVPVNGPVRRVAVRKVS